jgi:hypothetical protein
MRRAPPATMRCWPDLPATLALFGSEPTRSHVDDGPPTTSSPGARPTAEVVCAGPPRGRLWDARNVTFEHVAEGPRIDAETTCISQLGAEGSPDPAITRMSLGCGGR